MRKVATIAWAVGVGLALLAAPAAAKKTTIRVMVTYGADFLPVQRAFDKDFMKRHPDISVKLEVVSWGTELEKYIAMSAAGVMPDVVYAHWSYAQNLLRRGLVLDLSPYIKKAKGWDYEDIYPIANTPFLYKGKIYGIPYDAGPVLPYYNVKMLEAAGVKAPYNNYTHEDWLLMLQKLTRDANGDGKPEIYGTDRFCDAETWPGLIVKPWGGEYLSADEQTVLCDSKEAIAGIRWWSDLKTKYNVASGGWTDFPAGKAAFSLGGSWMLPAWLMSKKITADVCHAPTGPKGQFAGIYGAGYCIPTASKNKEAAWTYMQDYLSASTVKVMYGDSGRGSPSRRSAWASFEEHWKGKNVRAFREAIPYCTYGVPLTPVSPRFNEMFWREMNAVFAKKKSVEQAVSVIKKEGDPILHTMRLK